MKWVTTRHVHMDRVASAWLIRRFIDEDAEFVFIPSFGDFQGPADAIQFAIRGATIGPHDANGTCFEKLVRHYGVTDPAVHQIAQVVRAGVEYVLHGYRPPADDRLGQIAVGLVAMSDGMRMICESDLDVLASSAVIYDSLYATFRTEILMAELQLEAPDHRSLGAGPRTEFYKALLLEHPPERVRPSSANRPAEE